MPYPPSRNFAAPKRWTAFLLSMACAVAASGLAARAQSLPSFNCRKARSPATRTICRVPTLGQLDRQLTSLFISVDANLSGAASRRLKAEQRAWVTQRDLCRRNVTCLENAYRERIAELRGRAAMAGGAGQRWGAASTTASAITGDIIVFPDHIRFANGAQIGLKPVGADRPGVYAISPPTNPVLLNGNQLCGPKQPTYAVLGQSGGTKSLKIFEGTKVPQPSNGPYPQPGVCAVYNYE